MRESVAVVHGLVSGLVPADDQEARHRSETLHWLRRADDVFRRIKPAIPPRHLVSYVVPVDPVDGGVLLVDHLNAGLWLPPGGHVDPDEHPTGTARREAYEELGVPVDSGLVDERPAFLTVTEAVGIDAGHTDVSLWYLLRIDRARQLRLDSGEFREARWWTPADIAAADPTGFDPHFIRFWAKLRRTAP
ncbi:NUDIX hydrolase [Micromonospora sp. WMMD1102]|uniref:NUDIX domain-containing protein n=1 Tax=Micromonospora sp. WMMD1102 TaxID=3016105 RepID=UPI0024152100|nr:NUDIX hydrolase [Micromonospora sp. WMMD1102]MDG4790976.1 NUDIX hydrolase [Micromonospora sp. WMMD1102]